MVFKCDKCGVESSDRDDFSMVVDGIFRVLLCKDCFRLRR